MTTPPPRRSPRLFLQALGFLAGLALLFWCASIAFSEENRENLQKLREATPTQIALLLALSLASQFLNGIIFLVTLRPVRRLALRDTVAVNAIAAFLAYLPFKLSILVRIAIHNRRQGVPLFMIGSWFAAVAFTLLATLGGLAATSLLSPSKDISSPRWFVPALLALLTIWAVTVGLSRLFAGEMGLARIRGFCSRPAFLARLLASDRFAHLHAGTSMLSHPRLVALNMTLRVLDIALQAARVPVAAAVLGLTLPYSDAFLIASTAFLVGIISPAGPVGTREAAVVGVCKLLHLPNADAFAIVALLVSATEALAYLVGASLALAHLNPTKLFKPSPQ